MQFSLVYGGGVRAKNVIEVPGAIWGGPCGAPNEGGPLRGPPMRGDLRRFAPQIRGHDEVGNGWRGSGRSEGGAARRRFAAALRAAADRQRYIIFK